MTKLAVWSMDVQRGSGGSQQSEPQRIGRFHVRLERHLEELE